MSVMESIPREEALEAGGYGKGVAVAIVAQNKDDSGLGRIRVTYPWHDSAGESYWARVAMPMAGKGRGVYFIPEVGDEVLVAFERGDLRFPYIVGSLWNGVDGAPETNADGKNDRRVIKTRKGHQLSFDDGDAGSVRLKLNDGKLLVIDDDGIRLDDGSGNSLVIDSRSGSMTLQAAASLSLKAPQVTIESSATLSLKSSGPATVQATPILLN